MSADVGNHAKAIEGIRHELKKWEWQFKQTNGRKPGRDDVKNDATISAKYEEYDRLSGRGGKARNAEKIGSGADESNGTRVLKERPANLVSVTPKKSQKNMYNVATATVDTVLESEDQPTPACIRFALGPTPQKDGAILGLFDMLPSATPSKGSSIPLDAVDSVIAATPSKSNRLDRMAVPGSTTPQSSSKRHFLDVLRTTPLKRKREDDINSTPSTTKRQYATPAFLRRSHTLPTIGEDGEEPGPIPAPSFGRRGLVRSLSAIIQGLRKQEEERMDDEWDVLNEIEAEERGEVVQPTVSKLLVEDSQAVEMPLGPDQGIHSDEDADSDAGGNAVDASGRVRKPWKKKGLKRQTRRVIMRPVLNKPKKAADAAHSDDDEDESSPEQEREASAPRRKPSDDEDYDLQNDAEDDQEQPMSKPDSTKSKKKTTTKSKNDESQGQEARPKRTTKVNALAHMNFRALKIKNKNSKSNGRGRRFGRR